MELFSIEPPVIFAEELSSVELLEKHLKRLQEDKYSEGHLRLNEAKTAIERTTYETTYGGVDERKQVVVSLGAWVVWCSTLPGDYSYHRLRSKTFDKSLIPSRFLSAPGTPKPMTAHSQRKDPSSAYLW